VQRRLVGISSGWKKGAGIERCWEREKKKTRIRTARRAGCHARIYESKTKGRNLQENTSSLMRRRETEARETAPDVLQKDKTSPRLAALSVGSKWNERHEASSLLSNNHLLSHLLTTICVALHHRLYRLGNEMKLPKFLRVPKFRRRTRSKAGSEISPVEDQSEASLVVPPFTQSTPDLRIGTSTLPTPSPLIPRNQDSNGM
jgi:hypothetical protein